MEFDCTCRRPDIQTCQGLLTCSSCGAAVSLEIAASNSSSHTHNFAFRSGLPDASYDRHTAPRSKRSGADTNLHQPEDSQYVHVTLDLELGKNIRLISLLRGQYHDPVVCQVYSADLDENPSFEAVSYTWGDEQGDASLSAIIHCPHDALKITKNCENVLRRIRLSGLNRTLWIDSICIDQTNTRERNLQVSIMKEIYSKASRF
jgi:hypothetical protein